MHRAALQVERVAALDLPPVYVVSVRTGDNSMRNANSGFYVRESEHMSMNLMRVSTAQLMLQVVCTGGVKALDAAV